jgi:hypothetical protein
MAKKKLQRVEIRFTKKSVVVETGELSVDVEDKEDWEEILAKAQRKDCSQFLVQSRDYDETEWEFEPMEEENDNPKVA